MCLIILTDSSSASFLCLTCFFCHFPSRPFMASCLDYFYSIFIDCITNITMNTLAAILCTSRFFINCIFRLPIMLYFHLDCRLQSIFISAICSINCNCCISRFLTSKLTIFGNCTYLFVRRYIMDGIR